MFGSSYRPRLIGAGYALALAVILGRAFHVQVVQHTRWRLAAQDERQATMAIPAARGAILDRHGAPLALTQELFHVGVAPNEIAHPETLLRVVREDLGAATATTWQERWKTARYLYAHGPFTALEVARLRTVRGIHLESVLGRVYPVGAIARALVGTVDPDSGFGLSGLERQFDVPLRGRPGEAGVIKDPAGRAFESPARRIRDPQPGQGVRTTIDARLQDLAEAALRTAVEGANARGGDVVVLDAPTGDLLAVASLSRTPEGTWVALPSALTVPYEPGSTAKIFTAAALLETGFDTTRTMEGYGGTWTYTVGRASRVITDAHGHAGPLTLRDAIRISSNVATVQFGRFIPPAAHADLLRALGLGQKIGLEYPSEARGIVVPVDRWSPTMTQASVAMGYELLLTPVQLAAAYGAIANNGRYVAPHLLRDTRPITREVLRPAVTKVLQSYLADVVDDGTALRARLTRYGVGGKTGTAVKVEQGHYAHGRYVSSFAAMFPVSAPRWVIVVKIDEPVGAYFGGLVAAPVVRAILEGALTSPSSALDRFALAFPGGRAGAVAATVEPERPPVVVSVSARHTPEATSRVLVPAVVGATVRDGVTRLLGAGLQVIIQGEGARIQTQSLRDSTVAWGTPITIGVAP